MENTTLHHVNAMPAPTWHRLHMNEMTVKVPALPFARDVVVEAPTASQGDPGAFEQALERLEQDLRSTGDLGDAAAGPGLSSEDATALTTDVEAGALDQLALTPFQIENAAIEASGSLGRALSSGMGAEAYAYLRDAAGATSVIVTSPDARNAPVVVRVVGVDGAANVASLDVVAAEGSELAVQVLLDAPAQGKGVVGTSLRVFAGRDARISLTVTQTAGDGWTVLDDTIMLLDNRAQVEVRHTVLGAGRAYTSLVSDLRGEEARSSVDTRYLGQGGQLRDFTYTMHHHGIQTESAMNASGVLAGASKKTLRGTIDFIRGCKGASGHESETVLLADDRTHNRSVPVILCGEDDVAGNHGATIGHVRSNQLLYLQSRGLSPEAIERLFLRATFEEAAFTAPDDFTRAAVVRLGSTVIDDLEEAIA